MHWLQDMAIRGTKKQFELVWRGAKSYGSSADVLTGNFASGTALMPAPLPCQPAPAYKRLDIVERTLTRLGCWTFAFTYMKAFACMT